MASERVQRRIDILLDEADQAIAQSDWSVVRDRAQNVLALDPDNGDAATFLAAADRALASSGQPPASTSTPTSKEPTADQPHLFRQWPLPGQAVLGRGRQEEDLPGPGHDSGPRGSLRPNQDELGMRPLMERVLSRREILKA